MGTVFCIKNNTIHPQAGTHIIKAQEANLLIQANSLLNAAQNYADTMQRKAEEAYEAKKQEGYTDGQEEGKMEHAEKMMETVMASVEFIEQLEHSLVDVVSQVLRRILGEMGDNERIVALVRQALLSVRNQQRVLIRLAPADEPAVRQALAPLLQSNPASGNFLDILADARLERGACLLESELGIIDASLETQLTALEKALRKKIQA
ncbi:MAG: HrpE/YscL family type III secretion apparatus protein [Desulfovibrionaceae bacterium]|nr:HrpE/YscL family type III secretion apparatus protein [Desulfovibrionaceae bacterium]